MGSPNVEQQSQTSSGSLYVDTNGNPTRVVDAAESIDGPYVQTLCDLAKRCAVWLSVGGFPERVPEQEKVYNTHFLISPAGNVVQPIYRKIHLFDNPLTGLMESKTTEAGGMLCVVDIGFARVGLTVCYDLRFPELYGALCRRLPDDDSSAPSSSSSSGTHSPHPYYGLGAEIVLVPSAFTVPTGQAHWLTLLRARAIENQCYVVAAAQVGRHNERRESYGESVIINPWGQVLAKATNIAENNRRLEGTTVVDTGTASCVFLKEIIPSTTLSPTPPTDESDVVHTEHGSICFAVFDRAFLTKTRAGMPVESHRRPDIYYPK
jgi:predicted amidohydrolase